MKMHELNNLRIIYLIFLYSIYFYNNYDFNKIYINF